MGASQGSSALQEQACWVILYVSAASVAISEAMGKKGAVTSVVSALRGHPTVEGVQVSFCL